jgi:3-oxoadipate enol-lactonase
LNYAISGAVRLAYDVSGPAGAPALLLINSIGATRDVLWRRQVPELAARFRVITYDTRGHGESDVAPSDYSLRDLGQDAVAVLDAVGVDTAHICGISMGGITALWLGVYAATRVRSLVVANSAARIGSIQSWSDRVALVKSEGMAGVAKQAMPKWFTPAFQEREPATVDAFRRMVESIAVPGYLGCCAALRNGDLRASIASIGAPTLAIAGSEDPLTPPDALAYIHAQVRGSRLVTLPCSHISNAELPAEFNAAVIDHLDRPAA